MRLTTTVALLLALAAAGASAQQTASARSDLPPGVQWGPAPPIFPPGAQMAVLQGNPSTSELFTVRLRLPNGYKIPPHTHPTDEHVTVIRGNLRVGMGKTFDQKGMTTLGPGGFVTAPANHPHYVSARGEVIVQVHAMGPFALTYVNPADTPRVASH